MGMALDDFFDGAVGARQGADQEAHAAGPGNPFSAAVTRFALHAAPSCEAVGDVLLVPSENVEAEGARVADDGVGGRGAPDADRDPFGIDRQRENRRPGVAGPGWRASRGDHANAAGELAHDVYKAAFGTNRADRRCHLLVPLKPLCRLILSY